MTSQIPSYRALRASPLSLSARGAVRAALAVTASIVALSTCAVTVLAFPPGSSADEVLDEYIVANAQSVTVPAEASTITVARDTFSSVSGHDSFVAGGTNHDWAKLVLLYAGFPITESNVTVFTRWMRQENGTDDWWNRNNPLNNGWGSGGGSGLGSYASLDIAAQNAAKALHGNPGYSAIVAGFASSAPTAQIESAIWASPWASSHYANGAHWSQAAVPVVKSPEGTW
ncbi:hypothetical protein HD599_002468 [Conyzicola lurida]|uniref:Uncharacterized protein n=1 Tax=Conyzicola lurida TaxID=1172621 RepID=A0A841ARF2_9MICO|nr:hypothetical protein [Conyzicola lurida]MBB5844145.1 hypothetical protein [Conyzicola lurida]